MDGLKQIMYGVTDFARMRTENAYYVDKTAFIRKLEKTNYTLFLRPRRFGKSLLCSVPQCYYDIDYAGEFENFFGGLAIGENPTPERGQCLWLDFNFSIVEKDYSRVQDSFNAYCCERIDVFVHDHEKMLPPGTAEVRSDALRRLDRHAAAHDIAKAWMLKPAGHVVLKRFVIVFHGADCVACEEIV